MGEFSGLAALAKLTATSLPPQPDASNRLAAMVLFTSGLDDAEGLGRLRCALSLLQDNIGTTTALDTYVWLLHNESRAAPAWLLHAPGTSVLRVPPEAWRLPAGLRPEAEWVLPTTAKGYRLMGMWRLGFAFQFARARCVPYMCAFQSHLFHDRLLERARGHLYMLQIDDDTFVRSRVPRDLVSLMRDGGYLVANRRHRLHETREVTAGLPELAAFFLATRRLQPTGPLYSHCTPADARGLHTVLERRQPGVEKVPNGWDAESLSGHFTLFDLEFWFSRYVQEFVALVWVTGAGVEQRWNELGPQSMLRHMFVPDSKFYIFSDVDVVHTKRRSSTRMCRMTMAVADAVRGAL